MRLGDKSTKKKKRGETQKSINFYKQNNFKSFKVFLADNKKSQDKFTEKSL